MAPENYLQKVIYLPRFTVFEKQHDVPRTLKRVKVASRIFAKECKQSNNQPTNQPTNRHICKQLTLEYGRPLKTCTMKMCPARPHSHLEYVLPQYATPPPERLHIRDFTVILTDSKGKSLPQQSSSRELHM